MMPDEDNTSQKNCEQARESSLFLITYYYFTSHPIKASIYVKATIVSSDSYVFNFLEDGRKDKNTQSFLNGAAHRLLGDFAGQLLAPLQRSVSRA